jgi:transposase InsO family protein
VYLLKIYPTETWPAVSTINLILKRNNLIVEKHPRRHITPMDPIYDPKESNEIWSADFKGKFLLRCQHYCHTLTVADSFNRYLIAADCFYSPSTANTISSFTRIFRDYGMPVQLHTDNGAPSAAQRRWAG